MGVGNPWCICVVHAIGASGVDFSFLFFQSFFQAFFPTFQGNVEPVVHEPCRQLQNTAENVLEARVTLVLLTC